VCSRRRAAPRPSRSGSPRNCSRKLDALGGQNVTEDSLLFSGTQFILPEQMEGKIDEVVDFLNDWDRQQNAEFEFVRTFNFQPFDGAAAFNRAMKRVFATTGIGKATFSFFGKQPPQYRSVPAGPGGRPSRFRGGRSTSRSWMRRSSSARP